MPAVTVLQIWYFKTIIKSAEERISLRIRYRASKMAQWFKTLAMKPDEFSPRSPFKVGGIDL